MTFWQMIAIHVLPPAISAIGVILAAWITVKRHTEKQVKKIEEVHLAVNHRLEDYIEIVKQMAHEEGRQAERDSR